MIKSSIEVISASPWLLVFILAAEVVAGAGVVGGVGITILVLVFLLFDAPCLGVVSAKHKCYERLIIFLFKATANINNKESCPCQFPINICIHTHTHTHRDAYTPLGVLTSDVFLTTCFGVSVVVGVAALSPGVVSAKQKCYIISIWSLPASANICIHTHTHTHTQMHTHL